jgi:hypothetical protein
MLLLAAGFVAWGVGIVFRNYDYDEIQRAHSVWLALQGLRPYSEMFEVHPPYFILLTPILRWWTDPCEALLALRLFSAVGNLAFLGALVALGSSPRRGDGGGLAGDRWAWLGVAFVAFHPRVLDFLVEFRIDGWGYALAGWSIVGILRRGGGVWAFAAFGVGSGIATLLFCPKLALLPPLIVAFELIRLRPGLRTALAWGAAYLVGVGAAGLGFALFLALNGITLERTYWLLFRYHTLSNAHSGYRHGLLRQLVAAPLLLGAILLGVVAWALTVVKRRSFEDAYHPALALWLVVQALLVAYPYKQYYAPWFLFASAFVVILGRSLDALWRPLGSAAALVGAGATALAVLGIAHVWQHYGPARSQCVMLRALNQLAGRDDRVVAPPDVHPIVRRDVFFLWFNTSDPRGYDSERILAGLAPYRREVSPEQNQAALRAHPPAFVVLDAGPYAAAYPEGQWRALGVFLRGQGYRVVRLGSLRLALRPDRYARLHGQGLFEDAPGPLLPVMPEPP